MKYIVTVMISIVIVLLAIKTDLLNTIYNTFGSIEELVKDLDVSNDDTLILTEAEAPQPEPSNQ